MHFKKLSGVIVLLVSFLCFSSCSYFFDEKSPKKLVSLERQHNGLAGCLDQSGRIFNAYLEDFESTDVLDRKIKELTACYDEVLTLFVKHTKSGGDDSEVLNGDQILNFFDRIYENHPFTVEKIDRALQLKSFFIGGSESELTYSEIIKSRDLLNTLGNGLLRLRSHREVLIGFKGLEKSASDLRKLDRGFSVLTESVESLFLLIEKNASTSRRLDLEVLGQFWLETLYTDVPQEKIQWLNLSLSFKRFIMNQDHNFVHISELNLFSKQLLRTFRSIVDYFQFLKDPNLFPHIGAVGTFITRVGDLLRGGEKLRGLTPQVLSQVLERTFQSFESAIGNSREKTIDEVKFKDLIFSLEEAGVIGESLSAKTLNQFMAELLKTWIGDRRNPGAAGLTRGKVNVLRHYSDSWLQRLEFINRAFTGNAPVPLEVLQKLEASPQVKVWLKSLDRIQLVNWYQNKRLYFSKTLYHPELKKGITHRDAIVSSSIFSQAEFFMHTFQKENTVPTKYSVNVDQAQSVYEFLRILGLEIQMMDARLTNTGERSFMEANNFTTQLRNDDRLDFYEISELLAIIYSSDQISSEIYEDIPKKCFAEHEDVLGKLVVKSHCFRRFFMEGYGNYFQHMGGLYQFWQENPGQRGAFVTTLEKAAREGVIQEREISMGDIRTMVSISYYLQSVLYNFEKDGDNLLSGDEIPAIQEHFSSFIENFIFSLYPDLKNPTDSMKQAYPILSWVKGWINGLEIDQYVEVHASKIALGYLLDNGQIPNDLHTLSGKKDFGLWWYNTYQENWVDNNAQVDALEALSVFSVLGDSNRALGILALEDLFQKKSEILQNELQIASGKGEIPQCPNPHSNFCTLAAKANCSSMAQQEFFAWISSPEVQTQIFTPGGQPVSFLSAEMNAHPVFSTQCMFPFYVEPVESD